jgi:hypothetical protein
MRSDPFCSTLTCSEHGTITFLSQQFFAKGPRPRSVSDIANFSTAIAYRPIKQLLSRAASDAQ